jgi:hypothetical protein
MLRLRTLSEAECYLRCYGERSAREAVQIVRVVREPRRSPVGGDVLRLSFETRLDTRPPEAA